MSSFTVFLDPPTKSELSVEVPPSGARAIPDYFRTHINALGEHESLTWPPPPEVFEPAAIEREHACQGSVFAPPKRQARPADVNLTEYTRLGDARNEVATAQGLYAGVIFGDEEEHSLAVVDNQRDTTPDSQWYRCVPEQQVSDMAPPSRSASLTCSFLDTSRPDTTRVSLSQSSSSREVSTSDETTLPPLPIFAFALDHLSLISTIRSQPIRGHKSGGKVNLLVKLLHVEDAQQVTTRDGRRISMGKMVVMDEKKSLLKVTLWGEVADEWTEAMRSGDVVYMQGIAISTYQNVLQGTASVRNPSRYQICYRSKVYDRSDKRYNFDLRFAEMDLRAAKVKQLVRML